MIKVLATFTLLVCANSAQADAYVTCVGVTKIMVTAETIYHNPTPRGIVLDTEITIMSDDVTVVCDGKLMSISGVGEVSILKPSETAIFAERPAQ